MKIKKYISLALINLQSNTVYIRSYIISKTFLIFFMIIMFNLFKKLYAGKSEFEGYTISMILYYLAITESIEFANVRIYRTISEEIKDGTCAYNLLRPVSYLSCHFFASLGAMIINFFITLLIGLATASILTSFDIMIIINIFFSLPAILSAICLNFIIMLIIGLLAFYIEEVSPVYWIYQKFVFILGGMLIPLDFFPVWLRNIVRFLPMAYISYFPARLCTNFNGILYLKGFAMQITYILLFIILLSFLFSRGKKRLQVHGG